MFVQLTLRRPSGHLRFHVPKYGRTDERIWSTPLNPDDKRVLLAPFLGLVYRLPTYDTDNLEVDYAVGLLVPFDSIPPPPFCRSAALMNLGRVFCPAIRGGSSRSSVEDVDFDMIEKRKYSSLGVSQWQSSKGRYSNPICVIIPALTSALASRRSGEPCHLSESPNKHADETYW